MPEAQLQREGAGAARARQDLVAVSQHGAQGPAQGAQRDLPARRAGGAHGAQRRGQDHAAQCAGGAQPLQRDPERDADRQRGPHPRQLQADGLLHPAGRRAPGRPDAQGDARVHGGAAPQRVRQRAQGPRRGHPGQAQPRRLRRRPRGQRGPKGYQRRAAQARLHWHGAAHGPRRGLRGRGHVGIGFQNGRGRRPHPQGPRGRRAVEPHHHLHDPPTVVHHLLVLRQAHPPGAGADRVRRHRRRGAGALQLAGAQHHRQREPRRPVHAVAAGRGARPSDPGLVAGAHGGGHRSWIERPSGGVRLGQGHDAPEPRLRNPEAPPGWRLVLAQHLGHGQGPREVPADAHRQDGDWPADRHCVDRSSGSHAGEHLPHAGRVLYHDDKQCDGHGHADGSGLPDVESPAPEGVSQWDLRIAELPRRRGRGQLLLHVHQLAGDRAPGLQARGPSQ
mmetsp:Transcript_1222/g.5178  ORF Transcript_1222/g.5178 Transcript_1222/m.5178 type:complete len:448 (-) Transcript_1222:518-1861(-)